MGMSVGILGVVVGLIVVLIGWRGRRVGDHPYCRRCGFDLHGKADSTTLCPECGADTTGSRAVVVGQRHARRRVVAAGLTVVLLAGVPTGLVIADRATSFTWLQYRPFGWVLADALQHLGTLNEPNAGELHRRYIAGSLSASQTRQLVQAALQAQGDRTQLWSNVWRDLLELLLRHGHLSPAEVEQYLSQSFAVSAQIKPTLRRGRPARLVIHSWGDRLAAGTAVHWEQRITAVRLGDVEVLPAGTFGSNGGQPADYFNRGATLDLVVPDGGTSDPTIRLITSVEYRFTPTTISPVTYTVSRTVDLPVRLVNGDDPADTFAADPAQRLAMRGAIRAARIVRRGDVTVIQMEVEDAPVALAMLACVRMGDSEYPVGAFRVAAGTQTDSVFVERAGLPPIPRGPATDIVLRPSAEAADTALTLDTYWGEPISITRPSVRHAADPRLGE